MRKRLEDFKRRCDAACERAGRPFESVKIVAVSKGQPVEKIVEAYELGVRDFGENYAPEMSKKMLALKDQCPEISWHFLGHIQSNKMRAIAATTWIHSLSEYSHAKLLSELTVDRKKALLQVNLGEEANRSGVLQSEMFERYRQISELDHIDLCGLMTIAPLHEGVDPKFWFRKMQVLRKDLADRLGREVPELSMGMSADFEDAILCGATWVRVGTLLFGERRMK